MQQVKDSIVLSTLTAQNSQHESNEFNESLKRCASDLCALRRDLQKQSQGVVVEGLVQGDERSMNTALQKVAGVVL